MVKSRILSIGLAAYLFGASIGQCQAPINANPSIKAEQTTSSKTSQKTILEAIASSYNNIRTRRFEREIEYQSKNAVTESIETLPQKLDGSIVVLPIVSDRNGSDYKWNNILGKLSEKRQFTYVFKASTIESARDAKYYLDGVLDEAGLNENGNVGQYQKNIIDTLKSSGLKHQVVTYDAPALPEGSSAFVDPSDTKTLVGEERELQYLCDILAKNQRDAKGHNITLGQNICLYTCDINQIEPIALAMQKKYPSIKINLLFPKGHIKDINECPGNMTLPNNIKISYLKNN